MENKIEMTFTRAEVERIIGVSMLDKQWEVLASELEGALEFYFEDEIPRLWSDIDYLVSLDKKYD
jgi:hypothetical protein